MLVLAECVQPVDAEPIKVVVDFDDLLPVDAPLAGHVTPEDPRLPPVVAGVHELEHLLREDEGAQGEEEAINADI